MKNTYSRFLAISCISEIVKSGNATGFFVRLYLSANDLKYQSIILLANSNVS